MQSYRDILRLTLEERIRNNPRYSLRAFAKNLGLAAPRLSCILANKQGISEKVANQICDRLGLTEGERQVFVLSALSSDARSKSKREKAQEKLKDFLQEKTIDEIYELEEEKFKIISDWYHYALLELILTKDFKSDVNWIAKRLGISVFEVNQSLVRLKNHGLIDIKNGTIIHATGTLTTTRDIPSKSIKHFNRQILQKAQDAIDLQGVDERDFSTLTIGIGRKHLPQFKEIIKKCRREMNQLAESLPISERENVYILSANFFNLTSQQDQNE